MPALYRYTPSNPSRLANNLVSQGYVLSNEQLVLAHKLAALPPCWWFQIGRLLNNKDLVQTQIQFNAVTGLIDQLASLGLGLNPSWSTLCAVYSKIKTLQPDRFKSHSSFCRHVYQLIERIGQHLLIPRLEQSGITNHVRKLIDQHRRNAPKLIKFGRVLDGYKSASVLKNERAAERMNRLEGINDFYMRDLCYVSVPFTITAPAFFNSGYGDKLNPAWIKAGSPSALDAHRWIQDKLERIDDAARKIGIKLHGFRSVEVFKNGLPHQHGQYYVSKADSERLLNIMQRIIPNPETVNRGAFKKSKPNDQALVVKIEDDAEKAATWLSYCDKSGHGREMPENEQYSTFCDEDAAFLWGWHQHVLFGQQPIANWRMFKRLDRNQLENQALRETLPKPILNAWQYSTGFQIINGRPTYAQHDYRAFLRLTEPEYQHHKKTASVANWTPAPRLQFKRTRLHNNDTVIQLITNYDADVSVLVPAPVSAEFQLNELQIFETRYSAIPSLLKLRIRLPTDTLEPPPEPEKPPRPTEKVRFRFEKR